MPMNPQRARLDAELANLDQQLRAVNSRHDFSDGERVLLRGGLQHKRQKKYLEREILGEAQVVESRQRDVERVRKQYQWTQTPDGVKALAKQERRRMAGMALGGGSNRRFTPSDMLAPEQRVIERAMGDLARAENTLRNAQGRLADLRRQLHELEAQDADWEVLRPVWKSTAQLPGEAGPTEQKQWGSTQSGGTEPATWDAVEISFLSDERVQIRAKGTPSGTYNYAELGFADRRNGKPNQAWVTLRALAEERGIIRDAAKTGQAWPKVEKRIQEIRKVLRKHFGIAADPIPFVEGTGYQALFQIGWSPSYQT